METTDLIEIRRNFIKPSPVCIMLGSMPVPTASLPNNCRVDSAEAAGLTIAYLGVETGDPDLLQDIRKGVTYDEMGEAENK
jgi:radical SAM superfamily enzyme YgiQ (UPF0313 family)